MRPASFSTMESVHRFATRAPISLAGAALLVAALAGCSPSQFKPVDDYAGEAKGVAAPASSAGGASWAAWLADGRQIGIVLYGSSTCPPLVESISVVSKTAVKAMLAPAPGGVCTRDYAPHTTVFDTPSGVSPTSRVDVQLPDATLTLAPQPG